MDYSNIEGKVNALRNSYIHGNPLENLPEGFFEKQERVLKTEEGKKLYQSLAAFELRCFQDWLYQTNDSARKELIKYINAIMDIDNKIAIKEEQRDMLKEKDEQIKNLSEDYKKLHSELKELKTKLGG